MMIDNLIDQMVKLRKAYGPIEVDFCDTQCFGALHDQVAIRIDEFGDVLAVLQSVYRKKKYKFNKVMQNDSWLQFKGPNTSDKEAKRLWAEAGKPSKMHPVVIKDSVDTRPLMGYAAIWGQYSLNLNRFETTEVYMESRNTGDDLLADAHNTIPSIGCGWKFINLVNLGAVKVGNEKTSD
jgi:hypothetical protein